MPRPITAFILILLGVSFMTAAPPPARAAAQVRTDTPSGLPVPRFVGLRSAETPCRAGPSQAHAVAITYMRAGAPMLVVAETTDHWRKLRDIDGAECWVRQGALRAPSHAIVLEEATLRAQRDPSSPVRARLAPRVMARVERVEGDWARLSAEGLRGWTPTRLLWGVSGDIAPHN